MDRGHLNLIKNVRSERLTRPDRVALLLDATPEAQLEVWAVQAQAPAFEKTFDLPMIVRLLTGKGDEAMLAPMAPA
jgi:hypothetical protein